MEKITEKLSYFFKPPKRSPRSNSDIQEFYLGLGAEGAVTSYRDLKHYKRRKRWVS